MAVFRLLCHRVRLGLDPVPPRLSIHVNFGPFKLTLWLPCDHVVRVIGRKQLPGALSVTGAVGVTFLGDRATWWVRELMGPGLKLLSLVV